VVGINIVVAIAVIGCNFFSSKAADVIVDVVFESDGVVLFLRRATAIKNDDDDDDDDASIRNRYGIIDEEDIAIGPRSVAGIVGVVAGSVAHRIRKRERRWIEEFGNVVRTHRIRHHVATTAFNIKKVSLSKIEDGGGGRKKKRRCGIVIVEIIGRFFFFRHQYQQQPQQRQHC